MNDFVTSLIRTIVPIVVGFVITQAARIGIELDSVSVGMIVTSVVSGVYYTVARLLEKKNPKAGLLLGKKSTPKY